MQCVKPHENSLYYYKDVVIHMWLLGEIMSLVIYQFTSNQLPSAQRIFMADFSFVGE